MTDTQYRCSCGKLLYKGNLFMGEIELRCKRCNNLTTFQRGIGESSGDHYAYMMRTDTQFVDFSANAPKILGYTRDELLSMKVSDLNKTISEADVARVQNATSKIMDNDPGYYFSAQTFHTTKEGRLLPIDLRAEVVGKNEDGTNLLRVECRIQTGEEAERRFITFASEHLGVITTIVKLDANGKCVGFPLHNVDFVMPCGHTPAQLMGRHITELFAESQVTKLWPERLKRSYAFLDTGASLLIANQEHLTTSVLFFPSVRKNGEWVYTAYIARSSKN